MIHTAHSLDRSFWHKLISIGLPVSMQSMLFSLLGVVDIFMVSQLGESATAAVGVGNRIFFFNLILVVGVSGAVGILGSQYFGSKNLDGLKRTLVQSWAIALVFTVPFSLLYVVEPEYIVSLIANDPAYITLATEYLYVTGFTLVCTALVVPLETALRSVGEAKLPTYVSILAIVVNLILNALLIFGLFGFPELGVLGAAIGTSISRLIQTIVLFAIVAKRYRYLIPKREHYLQAWQKSERNRFWKVATPMIIHDSAWASGLLIYNYIVGQLGVSELAIISLLAPIESVLISAFLGFAVAASVILGNEIGAKNYHRVHQTSWWYVVISCAIAFMVAVLCLVLEPLIYKAISLSPISDVNLAVNVCLVMAFGMVLRVFNMVGIGGVLKSGGDIKYSIFIDIFCQWGIGIPLAYYTALILAWPLDWVMMIILIEEIVKIGLTSQRIHSKKWINNLVEDQQPQSA
ncbi:MATE family efflux transporter [Vibrio mexicanus]|uniref:MATE family efflux transporter n=1 Tax=Vibrio mexicanus TaxID=1004326 RepID=UPI00063CB814|nr:MATE family efflux transporter [Vibrio mexicanus]